MHVPQVPTRLLNWSSVIELQANKLALQQMLDRQEALQEQRAAEREIAHKSADDLAAKTIAQAEKDAEKAHKRRKNKQKRRLEHYNRHVADFDSWVSTRRAQGLLHPDLQIKFGFVHYGVGAEAEDSDSEDSKLHHIAGLLFL